MAILVIILEEKRKILKTIIDVFYVYVERLISQLKTTWTLNEGNENKFMTLENLRWGSIGTKKRKPVFFLLLCFSFFFLFLFFYLFFSAFCFLHSTTNFTIVINLITRKYTLLQ